jgi:murein endopeptidase
MRPLEPELADRIRNDLRAHPDAMKTILLLEDLPEIRAWLRKLVPWCGHDSHFHIRLYCPPGNPQCQPQADYAHDDGCGEALESWFRKAPLVPPTTPSKPYRPKLPAACTALLNAR